MTSAPRWRKAGRLGVRLAAILAVALLPLGAFGAWQTWSVMRESRARAESALLGATLQAAAPEIRMIQMLQGIASGLAAAAPTLIDDPAACSTAMRQAVAQSGERISLAALVRPDASTDCASVDGPLDFSSSELVRTLLSNPRPQMAFSPFGRISGESVLISTYPAFDAAGTLLGVVSLSMPHSAIADLAPTGGSDRPLFTATFGEDGQLLTSSVDLASVELVLPADRPLASMAGSQPVAFTAPGRDGTMRTYSVVPVAPGRIYALGSWAAEPAPAGLLGRLPAAIFPGLMLLASLVVALWAAERQVARPIRRLRTAIRQFAGGARIVDELDLRHAPDEVRDTAEAFLKMTDTILHDEAELEDMVHQKEVLLREVHHRVKNNLQLIASIMNMQARAARSPEAKVLMKGLQDRVMSLATIHRELYQTTGLADIRADELMADIVRQVVNMGTLPGRSMSVETDFEAVRLTPDQAVPLALLLTEALTNAMKHAGTAAEGRPGLSVSLHRLGGMTATLTVANTLGPRPAMPRVETAVGSPSMGTQLLDAFTQQLGGTMEREETPDRFTLTVRFELRPLADAEHRNDSEAGEVTVPPFTIRRGRAEAP